MLKLLAYAVDRTKEFCSSSQDSFSSLLEFQTHEWEKQLNSQNTEEGKYSEDFENYVKNTLWPNYVPPTLTTHPEMILRAMKHAVERYFDYLKTRDDCQDDIGTVMANLGAGYTRVLSSLLKPSFEYQLIEKRCEGFTVAVCGMRFDKDTPVRSWDSYQEYSIGYDRKGANCTNFRLSLEKSSINAGDGCIHFPLPDVTFNGKGSYLDSEFANHLISFFDYAELGDSIFYLKEDEEVVVSTKYLEAYWASKVQPSTPNLITNDEHI